MVQFVCPHCSAHIEVDPEMRETILETGCVMCDAPVGEEAFR